MRLVKFTQIVAAFWFKFDRINLKMEDAWMKDYHINVFYSNEDKGYIADIPDLPGCSAFGATAQKALKEVQTAKKAWIKTARKIGNPIPPPRYRPAIYQTAA